MGEAIGRKIPLSPARRLVGDLLHFARQIPSIPVQKRMQLGALAAARRKAEPRPSWCAIFTKAYALVAAERPELRRAYISYPWGQLYEHPVSIASVAIERKVGDENAVLFTQVRNPEVNTLEQIDRLLRESKELPVERLAGFRWLLRISRLPWPVRRLLWWVGLHHSGYSRARYFGTFGVSVYSGLGAEALHPLSPLATTLNYGVIADDGSVDVRVVYDHRVLDGATVARALTDLEQILNERIPNLLSIPPRNGAARSNGVPLAPVPGD